MLTGRIVKTFILILIMVLAGACQVTGSITGDQPDGPPIKLPPEGKPGGDTADACGGVTERGECDGGIAVHCEVASNELRQVDCRALSQDCVIDPDRGASCVGLGLGQATDPQAACGGLVDGTGYCTEAGQAVWCDGESNQVYAWDCGQNGLACGVDACQTGAYCCDNAPPPDPTVPNECDTLGFEGECVGDMARWCTGSDTLIERDCAAQGKVCAVDQCAVGAYCCTPPEQVNPCPELGTYGECANSTTVNYCLGENVQQYTCQNGDTCMLDICFNGADCCSQAEYDSTCTALGLVGKCGGPTGNTAVWCDGTEIFRDVCGDSGKTCQIDVCGTGAWCC